MSSTCFAFLYLSSAELCPQDPQQHPQRPCCLTYMPPSPHQWNSAQTQMQSGKFLSITHPSFHPIHPSRPTSKEDGATDAALASAAPPLKGHTCSLLWAAVFRWNDRWHQNIILEQRRQNCRPERSRLSSCLSIADLRSCCRLYILPDNTESRAHAQWRRTGRSRDPQLTALLLTENEENMALTVWTSCVFASDERIVVQSVCVLRSKCIFKMLQGS